jgi:hypothetical protein
LLRLFFRSLRGRVIVFTAPIPVLMMGIVWKASLEGACGRARRHPGFRDGTAAVAVLAFRPFFPISSRSTGGADADVSRTGQRTDIVIGKAIGGGLAFAAMNSVIAVIAVALHPRGSALLWLAAIILAIAAYVVQTPVAAILSRCCRRRAI